ncbi:response regulator [Ekhidna sp.]|jgi:signal transduction histidine kinase/DNA-binding NarL/FixJ family response regulator|uniref:response regulator n=1 Tax=Ekhidna sp. TaxID=2608089 RepID=UPI0032EC3D32
MSKKSILILIACLIAFNIDAQLKSFLDSLKNDLQTVADDSLKMRLYDELAWTYKRIDADTALMYGKAGLQLAEGNDLVLEGIILATIGVTKTQNGIDDFGITELKRALEISQQLDIKGRLASNYTNLGNAFENLGRYDSAIYYTTKAIELKLAIGDSTSAAGTMGNLGLVYHNMNNPEKAMAYFESALEILGEGSRRSRGIFNNMGITLMKLEDYPKARLYLRKAIRGLQEAENERNFAITYGNIGETFYHEANYDSARYYATKAFTLKRKFGENLSLTYPAISLAKIHVELGAYEKAKEYAQLAYDISNQFSSLERQAEAMWYLGKIEANLGNFEEAAQLLFDYSLAYEEVHDKEIVRAAEEAEAKFQNELKEKENQLLRDEASIQAQQIRFQNTVIISIGVVIVLLVVIAILLKKQLQERKKLLSQIKTQSAKLKELDQAKSRFFANISHDLRSPLTLILGTLDKITERDYEILDKESKELLDLGVKNGKRLLYLADEIMDLTRLEEGKVSLELQYVKIVPYLRLLTKMFSSAADIKSIELRFSSRAEDETTLQIDPHQFEKIIYNLLSNAIKFTPENGKVDVQLTTKESLLEISISDTGSGIPDENLEFIFDRYYQSTESNTSQAGVGIGLALVKELVELHGGTIKATSGSDGSVFTIQFSFKKDDWVSKAIIPERSLDVVTRNSLWMDLQEEKERLQIPGIHTPKEDAKAVLIVEDHRELRSYLKSILNPDFRVFLAANGTSALDVLQTEKIDLIITDLMMPYMDGFELVDHLKKDKTLKKIPVVVVSARTDKKEKLDLIAKGAEDVISKPFDKEELMLKIQNILERDWDSNQTLSKLYNETAEVFEKNIMHRLEKLIIKRIDDPHLSVLDLADEMAASERKVYRMIKKISGLTPYELIKEVRWQYLENYLQNNDVRTATEAAQIIGMTNVSSFASQYEKRFGHDFKTVLEE